MSQKSRVLAQSEVRLWGKSRRYQKKRRKKKKKERKKKKKKRKKKGKKTKETRRRVAVGFFGKVYRFVDRRE